MRIVRSMFAAGLALGLAAGAPARAQAQPQILLGMVVGTTGAFAGGEAPLVNGTKLAVADLNAQGGIGGKRVTLVIEDTGSEQTGAMNAFSRIVGSDPVAIMDTTLSGFVLSQIGIIRDETIPTFTGAASAQLAPALKGADALFRIRTSDSRVPAAAAAFALDQLKARSLAILRINNEYGNGWRNVIEGVLKARGMNPAIVESYESSDRDLTPQLVRIKAANPDVIIMVGDPPNFVVGVQQIRQLKLTAKLIVSNAGVLPTTVRLYQGDTADGVHGTVDSLPGADPAQTAWAERYRKAYNIEPDYSAAEYYDGVMMLAAAIARVGTGKDALVKELRTLRSHPGVGNVYTYADKGDGGESVVIVEVNGGKLTLAGTK